MTPRVNSGQFLLGLLCGFLLGVAGLMLSGLFPGSVDVATVGRHAIASLHPLWETVSENLRASAALFALVLLVFCWQMSKLRGLLVAADPAVELVVRHEQLLDLCANLFFGIGVIWTAIGMRDALLFALGDIDTAAAQGAFSVLQRLVDGGILLSLSTTIVGGIGGYLLRVSKSVLLGHQLAALYMRASNQPAQDNLATLRRIERRLDCGLKGEDDRRESA